MKRRRGFSAVEIMVVLSVLCLLMAIVLPAVHRVREGMRRAQCQNNLRQLGIALHEYTELYAVFPQQSRGPLQAQLIDQPIEVNISTSAPPSQIGSLSPSSRGWLLTLLPRIEQSPLSDRLTGRESFATLAVESATRELLKMRIALFVCPSDVNDTLNASRSFRDLVPGERVTLSRSNYIGSGGDQDYSGVIEDRPIRISDIKDGLSTTIVIGERATENDHLAGLWGGINQEPGNAVVGVSAVLGFTRFRMNDGADGSHGRNPEAAYSSAHTGGSQFLFGDGSVRFVNDTIDWRPGPSGSKGLLNRLGDRADGNPVGTF